ncbi:hypothetical protein CEXT_29631 [Caerostris extrusa]|uniref:Uncharacterized protein n=1 Tax=Caerostris extrusa TaxID=172846 RepID=A0AAV4U5V8_CAEEX|nr:hypothetical protein CEXT_29631 [Caerostris extrusa]
MNRGVAPNSSPLNTPDVESEESRCRPVLNHASRNVALLMLKLNCCVGDWERNCHVYQQRLGVFLSL